MTGDQRKLASLWYGEGRERRKGRDKDRERRGGGEKEDGKRQRNSQIERGVVHILWSFAAAKSQINGLQHKHSRISAIFSGEARKEGSIAEARCASKLMKPQVLFSRSSGRGPGPVQVLNGLAGSYSGLSGHCRAVRTWSTDAVLLLVRWWVGAGKKQARWRVSCRSELLIHAASVPSFWVLLRWMASKLLTLASVDTRLGCLMQVADSARSSAACAASHVSNRPFVNLHRLHPFCLLCLWAF